MQSAQGLKSQEECDKLRKVDLVQIARSLSLPVSGTKEQVCKRIVEAVHKEMKGQMLITEMPKFAYKPPVFKAKVEESEPKMKQQTIAQYFIKTK